MKRFLILVVAGMVAMDVFAPVVRAQDYVVNGHAATKAEAQLLTSYSAPAGHWQMDGYGIARVATSTRPLCGAGRWPEVLVRAGREALRLSAMGTGSRPIGGCRFLQPFRHSGHA